MAATDGILCLTTGGSIDKTYSGVSSTFVVGAPAVRALVRDAKCARRVRYQELFRKDSLDLSDADRQVTSAAEAAIVITHGTDTMAKTAEAVAAAAIAGGKTVVVTGAMRPAAFKDSDAAFNVGAAFCCAAALAAGAHVVMNGAVFSDPTKMRKDVDRGVFVDADAPAVDQRPPRKPRKDNRLPKKKNDDAPPSSSPDKEKKQPTEEVPAQGVRENNNNNSNGGDPPAPTGDATEGDGGSRGRVRGRGKGRRPQKREGAAPAPPENNDAPGEGAPKMQPDTQPETTFAA